MNDPVFNHYPTLNANNSYYSVKSVLAKVREAIGDENSIKSLEETLLTFYTPSFNLDIDDNFVIIRVYPRQGEESTVTLSRLSGSTPEVVSGALAIDELPIASGTDPVDLIKTSTGESTIRVKVDPLAHSDTTIKRPLSDGKALGLGQESLEKNWKSDFGYVPIQNLYTTSFPSNPAGLLAGAEVDDEGVEIPRQDEQQKALELQMHLQVLNKIVADQIRGMSDDVRKTLVDEYTRVITSLESLTELVSEVDRGQKQFLGLADPDVFMVGKFTPADNDTSGLKRGLSLSQVLSKVLSKISNVDLNQDPEGKGPLGVSASQSDRSIMAASIDVNKATFAQSSMLSHLNLHNGKTNNGDDIPGIEWAKENFYYKSALKAIVDNSPSIDTQAVQDEISNIPVSQASTIGEASLSAWYASEMENLLTGQEKDSGAESWLATFTETVETATKALDWSCSSGEGLVVVQSIMNTIKEMASDGIDVARYTSQHSFGSYHELSQSDSHLGVKDLRLFPNMSPDQIAAAAEGEFEPPVHPTNGNFVSFACLIKFLHKVLNADLAFHEEADYESFLIDDVLGLANSDRLPAGNVWSIGELIKEFNPTYYAYSLNNEEANIDGHFDHYAQEYNSESPYSQEIREYWYSQNLLGARTDSSGFSSYQSLGVNWTKWDYSSGFTQIPEPSGYITTGSQLVDTVECKGGPHVGAFGNVIFHTVVPSISDPEYPYAHDPEAGYKDHNSSFFSTHAYRPRMIVPMYTYSDTAEQDELMNSAVMFDFSSEGRDISSIPPGFAFGSPQVRRDLGAEFSSLNKISVLHQGPVAGSPLVDYVKWETWAGGRNSKYNSLDLPWGNHPEYTSGMGTRHPELPIFFNIDTVQDDIENVDPENKLGHNPSNYAEGLQTWLANTTPPPDPREKLPNGRVFLQGQENRRNHAQVYASSVGTGEWKSFDFFPHSAIYALPIQWCRIYNPNAVPVPHPEESFSGGSKEYCPMMLGTSAKFTLENETVRNFYRAKGGGLIKFFGGLEGILKRLLVESNRKIVNSALKSAGISVQIDDDTLGFGNQGEDGLENTRMYIQILRLVIESLHDQMNLDEYNMRIDYDGNMVIETTDAPVHSFAGNKKRYWSRTLSTGTLGMKGSGHLAKAWVNFVSE